MNSGGINVCKKRMFLGKGDGMDLFCLSWECKMNLGFREKRIGTDEQFTHGILSTWDIGTSLSPFLPSLHLLGHLNSITEINRVEVHFGSIM